VDRPNEFEGDRRVADHFRHPMVDGAPISFVFVRSRDGGRGGEAARR
jgi:hypothetical protein